jgi:hypothetical protein
MAVWVEPDGFTFNSEIVTATSECWVQIRHLPP